MESNIMEPKYAEAWEESEDPPKESFRFKNRMVELSIANISLNVSDVNYIVKNPFYMLWNIKSIINDPNLIWQDSIVVNLEDFRDGFKFYADAVIKPLSLNFNWKDKWGFGFDIGHTYATGNLSLSGNMMTLHRTKKDVFGVGAAVFTDAGIPIFFHKNDFKIKFRPAVYVPIVYTEPGLTYRFESIKKEDGSEVIRLEAAVDMRVYSIVSLYGNTNSVWQDFEDNIWNILRKNTGYDFELGVEYPFMDNLDIGVDIVNIPVPYVSARLNYYTQFKGNAYFDSSYIEMANLMDGDGIPEEAYNYPDNINSVVYHKYDSNGKKIYRPFTTLFYTIYRPFDTEILSFIPSLGFSINHLYIKPGAIEGGLSARVDLANIFITTLGTNYNDHTWKNSIDCAFNFRAIELDIGLSIHSPKFKNSWRAEGLGVSTGVKLGW